MKQLFVYVKTFIKTLFKQLFNKSGVAEVEQKNIEEIRALPRFFRQKMKVKLAEIVRVCPGKRHAWFNSNVGVIRKPYVSN